MIKSYVKDIREICDLAFTSGTQFVIKNNLDFRNIQNWSDLDREKFTIACHDGYKKAQNEVIERILNLEK